MTWILYGQREGADPIPVELKICFQHNNDKLREFFGIEQMRTFGFWKKGFCYYYFNEEDSNNMSNSCYDKIINVPNFSKLVIERTETLCKKAINFVKNWEPEWLSKQSNQELADNFNKWRDYYQLAFMSGFITTMGVKILQRELIRILEQKEQDPSKRNIMMAILTKPKKTSLLTKANEELKQLADKVKNGQKISDEILEQYRKKYIWLGHDYCGPALTIEEVKKRFKTLINQEDKKQTSLTFESLVKKYNLNKKEQSLFTTMGDLSYIKEYRNTTDDYIHYHLNIFLKEIGKKFNETVPNLRYYWADELFNLLSTGKKLSPDIIKAKKSACLSDPTNNLHLIGEQAINHFNKEIGEEKIDKNIKEFKGITASPGKVQGRVKIVETVKDVNKVKQGDILVSPMTSPGYILAIHKAAAIVTNEGGLTCHAAIISRELNIPCVIGTKIATKILKDNDIIEVDANKGVIKKLQHQ